MTDALLHYLNTLHTLSRSTCSLEQIEKNE